MSSLEPHLKPCLNPGTIFPLLKKLQNLQSLLKDGTSKEEIKKNPGGLSIAVSTEAVLARHEEHELCYFVKGDELIYVTTEAGRSSCVLFREHLAVKYLPYFARDGVLMQF